MNEPMEMPVYLFLGFLEAGKTKFIKESLADPKFNSGEKTLLLVCEDGLEEYDEEEPYMANVTVETFEDEYDLTMDRLSARVKRSGAERVLIEYNGMWNIDTLFEAMPEGWAIYQIVFFADSNTILNYNTNIRQKVVEKIQLCDMTVFNRMDKDRDKMPLHKLVRGLSRNVDIVYEYKDGSIEYDNIADPMPFDIQAPVVEIEDRDFALFFRDLSEEPEKYVGKTLSFTGLVANKEEFPDNLFVIGRHIMTCCEADITYNGLACIWKKAKSLKSYDWRKIKAKVALEKCKIYSKKGPVLYVEELEETDPPEEKVATFY